MEEQISREVRKRVEEKMRIDYMLHQRMPQRFVEILVSEVIISLILYGLFKLGVVHNQTYIPGHWAALIIFWIITWSLASSDHKHTFKLKHYYLCNLIAYALFVLVAFLTFLYNYYLSGSFPRDKINFVCFRLSYVYGLVNDKKISGYEIIPSFVFFYGITLVIILIVPLIKKLWYSIKEHRDNRDEEMRYRFEEKLKREIEKEQEKERRREEKRHHRN